jgi:hypothetical protein
MIVDARALHTNVGRDVAKAEPVESPAANPALRRIHNGARHVTHKRLLVYLSIDRLLPRKTQQFGAINEI